MLKNYLSNIPFFMGTTSIYFYDYQKYFQANWPRQKTKETVKKQSKKLIVSRSTTRKTNKRKSPTMIR